MVRGWPGHRRPRPGSRRFRWRFAASHRFRTSEAATNRRPHQAFKPRGRATHGNDRHHRRGRSRQPYRARGRRERLRRRRRQFAGTWHVERARRGAGAVGERIDRLRCGRGRRLRRRRGSPQIGERHARGSARGEGRDRHEQLHGLARRELPDRRFGREDRARAAPGAASRIQGGQGFHAHPGSPDYRLGQATRLSRPTGPVSIERFPRGRGDRGATIRPVRF